MIEVLADARRYVREKVKLSVEDRARKLAEVAQNNSDIGMYVEEVTTDIEGQEVFGLSLVKPIGMADRVSATVVVAGPNGIAFGQERGVYNNRGDVDVPEITMTSGARTGLQVLHAISRTLQDAQRAA